MSITASVSGKTAQMRIYDPIDSYGAPFGISAKEFGVALGELSDDIDTIELHVHSPGGSAWDGLAIMNLLRQHPATVNVVVDGIAASAAAYIALGGDTLSMAPNSQMMIHDAFGVCMGTAEDMATMQTRLDKLSQNIASIYASKAGGSVDAWRAAMQPESWYNADEAVEAGLADRVLPPKPSDVANSKADAQSRFDLTIFNHAGRANAPVPAMPAKASTDPAKPPVPPTPKEADAMSDTIIKGLRERLGIADDAVMDDEAVLARYDELTAEAAAVLAAKPEPTPAETEPKIPEGKVLVSETLLAELKDGAAAGIEARTKQRAEERDAAILAAYSQGKISADRRESWTKAWDVDPEGTKADLESLEVRFPVAKAVGHAGSDGTDGEGVQPFTDDESDALAQLAGVSKEGLLA